MIVVADTSPFVGLIGIGLIDTLPQLYKSVVIPPAVAGELASPHRPPSVRTFIASTPSWLSVRIPSAVEIIADLDPGELEAISLARELKAELLLIDETAGRRAAIARKIQTVRTAAILFNAANKGLIPDLADAYARLRATNFRVPPEALDVMLKKHLEIQRRKQDGG